MLAQTLKEFNRALLKPEKGEVQNGIYNYLFLSFCTFVICTCTLVMLYTHHVLNIYGTNKGTTKNTG